MSRAQLATDAILVYSVSASVLQQSARQTFRKHVDEFHGDPMIPVESTKTVLLQY